MRSSGGKAGARRCHPPPIAEKGHKDSSRSSMKTTREGGHPMEGKPGPIQAVTTPREGWATTKAKPDHEAPTERPSTASRRQRDSSELTWARSQNWRAETGAGDEEAQ